MLTVLNNLWTHNALSKTVRAYAHCSKQSVSKSLTQIGIKAMFIYTGLIYQVFPFKGKESTWFSSTSMLALQFKSVFQLKILLAMEARVCNKKNKLQE